MKILITGANGFVGRALIDALASESGFHLLAMVRDKTSLPCPVEQVVADLRDEKAWKSSLSGVDVIVHLAARVHVMDEKIKNPYSAYSRINVEATRRLAQCAVAAGVRRFVFISTIKVNGKDTNGRPPFRSADEVEPLDPYSLSKYQAEMALQEISKPSGMELVIVRPPLIYGPGVKGNFLTILDLLARHIPLPLGAINNRRSMLALANFCDFLSVCVTHPDVAGRTLLVSDGEDLSTTEILQILKVSMHSRAWLIPLPVGIVATLMKITKLKPKAERLLGNLQVDPAETFRLTGWRPSRPVRDSLRDVAMQYLSDRK